jgi:hypothetical protein
MACGLALLASGQAFAGDYYSTGNIADADLASTPVGNWFNDGCPPTGGTGSTAPASISLTGTMLDMVTICAGHSLNLTTGAILNSMFLTFTATGTWGGTGLKFGAGNKTISNGNTSLPAIALNISSMGIGETIRISTSPVTFSSIAPTNKALNCGGSAAYSTGTPIAANTTCTVTVAIVPPTPPAVSAPIFSTKEKPAVFSEEVK